MERFPTKSVILERAETVGSVQENKKSFYFTQSHKKYIKEYKNIIRSIYFSYLYLDRKHIFVVLAF